MPILINILIGIFVLVAALMILVILMQRPKSEGLGAAFGGGVTENIFGAQTTNVLTRITGWLAGIFFILTFALSMLYAHQTNRTSGLRQELTKEEATKAVVPATVPPATGAATSPAPATSGAAPAVPLKPADQAAGVTAPATATAAPVDAPAPTVAPPGGKP